MLQPNVITQSNDSFYISYNNVDIDIYGDVTTALVLGQTQAFYILNGNHVNNYKALLNKGFTACYAYFIKNLKHINKYSDGR